MKRHLVSIIVIVVVTLVVSIYVRHSSVSDYKGTGTILQVENGYALVSRRTDLTEKDLLKSYDDWFFGNYDLIYMGPLYDVEPGMKVKFTIHEPVTLSYPPRANIKSYQIID